jgi:PRTRC genetic system protein A
MQLIGHLWNYEARLGAPARVGQMFDYIAAADGLYLHARRDELQVAFQISRVDIRGLEPMLPVFDFRLPKIPLALTVEMLDAASVHAADGLETLFHFTWSRLCVFDEGWLIEEPDQERSATRCKPLEDGPGSSHEKAIVEVHSHHSMPARFSATDDKDETGFRVYGVVGRLDSEPEIRMRVGVYGYHWEIPAAWVIALPEGLRDCISIEEWFQGGK